jgi:hypothetical protein
MAKAMEMIKQSHCDHRGGMGREAGTLRNRGECHMEAEFVVKVVNRNENTKRTFGVLR